MRKEKNKKFVWLYMGVLCCVIIVGVVLCMNMSGAGLGDTSTQKADASDIYQIDTIIDEPVPLSDGMAK